MGCDGKTSDRTTVTIVGVYCSAFSTCKKIDEIRRKKLITEANKKRSLVKIDDDKKKLKKMMMMKMKKMMKMIKKQSTFVLFAK